MLEPLHATNNVFLVDDDPAMRDSLAMALGIEGYDVESFADAEAMMRSLDTQSPIAIILDVMLPGQSGLAALKTLKARACTAPVMMITGHGDIPMAVEAIKLGARDFIEKPFSVDVLLDQLKSAIKTQEHDKPTAPNADFDLSKIGGGILSLREQQVLREIAAGASSKEAGRILGISPRTIEVHRARIMSRLGARNAADLMRIIFSQS